MATIRKFILSACAFASVLQAAPVVLTVTDIVTVTTWTTLDVTSTIWQDGIQNQAVVQTPSAAPVIPTEAPAAPAAPATTPIVPVPQAPAPVPAPAPDSVTSAITTTTTPVVQVQPAPSPSTPTTPAVFYQRPTTTLATSTTTSAIPRAASPSAASSASGGSCEGSGSACTGDITHWDGGLGACGWNVNTASDMQVALPVGLMGSQSNGNPYCGRSVTIKDPTTGKTVSATVGDKCMGCSATSIDLTDALFNAVTSGTGDGRVSGIEWWLS